jgi:hypothetical protein
MTPALLFFAALSPTREPAMRLLLYSNPFLVVINKESILINTGDDKALNTQRRSTVMQEKVEWVSSSHFKTFSAGFFQGSTLKYFSKERLNLLRRGAACCAPNAQA